MHKKINKIRKPSTCKNSISQLKQMDIPFIVLSELNFPFIVNLNKKYKDHLNHHFILTSVKRRS